MEYRGRRDFTGEEDVFLVEFLAKFCPTKAGRSSLKLYEVLTMNEGNLWKLAPNHPAQSWRNRYVKNSETFDRRIAHHIRKIERRKLEKKKRARPEEDEAGQVQDVQKRPKLLHDDQSTKKSRPTKPVARTKGALNRQSSVENDGGGSVVMVNGPIKFQPGFTDIRNRDSEPPIQAKTEPSPDSYEGEVFAGTLGTDEEVDELDDSGAEEEVVQAQEAPPPPTSGLPSNSHSHRSYSIPPVDRNSPSGTAVLATRSSRPTSPHTSSFTQEDIDPRDDVFKSVSNEPESPQKQDRPAREPPRLIEGAYTKTFTGSKGKPLTRPTGERLTGVDGEDLPEKEAKSWPPPRVKNDQPPKQSLPKLPLKYDARNKRPVEASVPESTDASDVIGQKHSSRPAETGEQTAPRNPGRSLAPSPSQTISTPKVVVPSSKNRTRHHSEIPPRRMASRASEPAPRRQPRFEVPLDESTRRGTPRRQTVDPSRWRQSGIPYLDLSKQHPAPYVFENVRQKVGRVSKSPRDVFAASVERTALFIYEHGLHYGLSRLAGHYGFPEEVVRVAWEETGDLDGVRDWLRDLRKTRESKRKERRERRRSVYGDGTDEEVNDDDAEVEGMTVMVQDAEAVMEPEESDYSPPETSRAGNYSRLARAGRTEEAVRREHRRASVVFVTPREDRRRQEAKTRETYGVEEGQEAGNVEAEQIVDDEEEEKELGEVEVDEESGVFSGLGEEDEELKMEVAEEADEETDDRGTLLTNVIVKGGADDEEGEGVDGNIPEPRTAWGLEEERLYRDMIYEVEGAADKLLARLGEEVVRQRIQNEM